MARPQRWLYKMAERLFVMSQLLNLTCHNQLHHLFSTSSNYPITLRSQFRKLPINRHHNANAYCEIMRRSLRSHEVYTYIGKHRSNTKLLASGMWSRVVWFLSKSAVYQTAKCHIPETDQVDIVVDSYSRGIGSILGRDTGNYSGFPQFWWSIGHSIESLYPFQRPGMPSLRLSRTLLLTRPQDFSLCLPPTVWNESQCSSVTRLWAGPPRNQSYIP